MILSKLAIKKISFLVLLTCGALISFSQKLSLSSLTDFLKEGKELPIITELKSRGYKINEVEKNTSDGFDGVRKCYKNINDINKLIGFLIYSNSHQVKILQFYTYNRNDVDTMLAESVGLGFEFEGKVKDLGYVFYKGNLLMTVNEEEVTISNKKYTRSNLLVSIDPKIYNSINHFSFKPPKGWTLASKKQINEQQQIALKVSKIKDVADLDIELMAFEGEEIGLDKHPKVYVVYHANSNVNKLGFNEVVKKMLSNELSGYLYNELNKAMPNTTFEFNLDRPYIDSAKKLVVYMQTIKYEDNSTTVVACGTFFIKNGWVNINFYMEEKNWKNYYELIKKTFDSFKAEPDYRLYRM